MNKVILMGHATGDPKITNTQDGKKIGKTRIGVRRMYAKKDTDTDFINLTGFEKKAEFLEKYVKKGTKILVTGRLQTGSYKDRDGKTVYTTDVIIEDIEFAESKKAAETEQAAPAPEPVQQTVDEWMELPDDIPDDLEVPFH